MTKFISMQDALDMIKDGDTLATEGFLNNASPIAFYKAMAERFLETGHPCDLTLVYAAAQDDGSSIGMNLIAREKLIKRVIAGHWNLAPGLGKLAVEEKIEAYNFPQGVIEQWYRDIAGGRIGTITHVGLKTFVDPRLQGGKLNIKTTEDLVKLVNLEGKDLLLYKAIPFDVCVIRATTADEKGNISMDKEGVTLGVTSIAQATKNSGGKVIVQVERVVKNGTLHPKTVEIPYIYVDAVVVVPHAQHMPETTDELIDSYNGNIRIPTSALAAIPLDERKIIARRAAMELKPASVVNLGIGVPEALASVANEEGISEFMSLTVEAGAVGGIPANGRMFGVALNPDAILDEPYQFDFYDGGGIDLAYLGMAETDSKGNVNVSKMGSRIVGAGGFINITQNAKKTFFCGTFTAKGLKVEVKDGKLKILQEGSVRKFIQEVGHVTFSGERALEVKQPVVYITERAVFELRSDGLHLLEVAPGIDIEKDILSQMDFKPKMDTPPKLMDERIFTDRPMGIK